MRKFILFQLVIVILLFGLIGCGTSNNGDENPTGDSISTGDQDQEAENLDEESNSTAESKQEGDFKVTIHVENGESISVYATIAYLGEEDKVDIYHGGSIFFFNIYQIDGDFIYYGGMDQPLLTTTLSKDEIHKVEFVDPVLNSLQPGNYEFEAIADISLDAENVVVTNVKIPVSKIVEIK